MSCINESILICCAVLVTTAVVIAAVYFAVTMNELAKTAKKLEETLDKANREIDSVHKISDGVITAASFFPKAWVKVAATVIPLVTPYIFKRRK